MCTQCVIIKSQVKGSGQRRGGEKMPFDYKKYAADYEKTNCRRIALKLNVEHDKAILDKLDSQKNKQGYIKQLILNDINK